MSLNFDPYQSRAVFAPEEHDVYSSPGLRFFARSEGAKCSFCRGMSDMALPRSAQSLMGAKAINILLLWSKDGNVRSQMSTII